MECAKTPTSCYNRAETANFSTFLMFLATRHLLTFLRSSAGKWWGDWWYLFAGATMVGAFTFGLLNILAASVPVGLAALCSSALLGVASALSRGGDQ